MKRPLSHQIDGRARPILLDALPSSWIANSHDIDYGKDYLVEIGENNGDLTGSSFYIQLKGKAKATFTADGTAIKLKLESKYATYYLDKIKDLPVFLVVVDVKLKKGRWLFLQPWLQKNQAWRTQDSITVDIPIGNDLSDTGTFRSAVEAAKRWMQENHDTSIHNAVTAHKRRLAATDPRFDVGVSLINDEPVFRLLAKEKVSITLAATNDGAKSKLKELLNKGSLVSFQPGELKIAGSKLFEPIAERGGSLQARTKITGEVVLICQGSKGQEIARIEHIPGSFTGGKSELWFDGEVANSPLSLRMGPVAPNIGGSIQINLELQKWDGQPLTKLGHFDRINRFYQALPNSESMLVQFQQDGNEVFSIKQPVGREPLVTQAAGYLEALWKARQVAKKFQVEPTFKLDDCDDDALNTAEELYAIFFEDGWTQRTPSVRFTADCIRETFIFDAVEQIRESRFVTLTSTGSYPFFGETIEVGRLSHCYSDVLVQVIDDGSPASIAAPKRKKPKKGSASNASKVKIAVVGSKDSVLRIRSTAEMPEK